MLTRFRSAQPAPTVKKTSQPIKTSATPNQISNDFQDILLDCRDCSSQFTYTASTQQYHQQMGYLNQPSRCKDCKTSLDPATATSTKPCFQFSSGDCSFGDKCRYLHEDKMTVTKSVNSVTVVTALEKEDSGDDGFELNRQSFGAWNSVTRDQS